MKDLEFFFKLNREFKDFINSYVEKLDDSDEKGHAFLYMISKVVCSMILFESIEEIQEVEK